MTFYLVLSGVNEKGHYSQRRRAYVFIKLAIRSLLENSQIFNLTKNRSAINETRGSLTAEAVQGKPRKGENSFENEEQPNRKTN